MGLALTNAYAAPPEEVVVLTKAVLRAAEVLNLTHVSLARVLGTSSASVSRLKDGRVIEPESKEGELALLLLRVFRSLDAFVGGSAEQARLWLHTHNDHLDAVPAELVEQITGLVRTVQYLDAMRGRG